MSWLKSAAFGIRFQFFTALSQTYVTIKYKLFICVISWYKFFTCVRIWYQFFTQVNFDTNFSHVVIQHQFFTDVRIWYRSYTRVRIWYGFLTFVKIGAVSSHRLSSSQVKNCKNVKFERQFYNPNVIEIDCR